MNFSFSPISSSSIPRSFPSLYSSSRFFTTTDVSIKSDLKTVTRDVVAAINEERDSLQPLDPKDVNEFTKQTGFQIEEKDGVVYLRKNVDNYSVTLTFAIPDDDFQNVDEETGNEDQPNEKEEGEEEGEEGEEENPEDEIEKTVELELIVESLKGGKVVKLHSDLAIGKDRNIYVENIRFGEKGNRLWTSDLNPPLQEKIYEFFESFKIDSDLANFVLEYRNGARSRDALETLKTFLDFLNAPSK
jgi:hypothetical protein